MAVYIAGNWEDKERLSRTRVMFESAGIVVNSSWLDEPTMVGDDLLRTIQADGRELAWRDLNEIYEASIFLVDTQYPASSRGGREFELGWAYGCGKIVGVVGPRRSVFHHLPRVQQFETWHDAFKRLLLC